MSGCIRNHKKQAQIDCIHTGNAPASLCGDDTACEKSMNLDLSKTTADQPSV
jgi:hypothetical protein